MRKAFLPVIFFFILLQAASDIPAKTEQFIYYIEAFNGKGFSSTFCADFSDTIYIMADIESFFQAAKSLVYFWSLTGKWQIDRQRLFEILNGYLQIRGKAEDIKTYHLQTYTYSNVRDEYYEDEWQVFLEEKANAEWAAFEQVLEDYSQAQKQYKTEMSIYEEYRSTLIDKIIQLQARGKDVSRLVEEAEALPPPKAPETPNYIVYPLQQAFALNLPAGEYQIRFIDNDGRIMEGSEKKLVAFKRRRTKGIGYDIIPGDKWTKPEKSFTPSSVIYIDGTTDLYVKPFFEDEFNDLYYNKMLVNTDRGNHNLYRWEEIKQVPGASLEITNDQGIAERLEEKTYIVEQFPGSSLGYEIVLYDPDGDHKNRSPSLKAFHIPVYREHRYIQFRLQTKDGVYNDLSSREIRVVSRNNLQFILVILALSPLVVMLIVLAVRRKRLKTGEQDEACTDR